MTDHIDPAWDVTYDLRARDPEGQLNGWEFVGECSNGRFTLRSSTNEDPLVVGELVVRSWQPYLDDALVDTARAARDVGCVLGAHAIGISFEPVTPAKSTMQLAGARSRGITVGVSVSAFMSVRTDLSAKRPQLDAASAVRAQPQVRADLDTFHLAKAGGEAATRFIHLYRIYDRRASELVDASPRLLSDEQAHDAAAAAVSALELIGEDAARVRQAVAAGLKRLRRESRAALLSRAWTDLLGRSVTPEEVRDLDSTRAKLVHTPRPLSTDPGDASRLLGELIPPLLKRDLETLVTVASEEE